MQIGAVGRSIAGTGPAPGKQQTAGSTFAGQLREAMEAINRQQLEADRALIQAASGEVDNLHSLLMITEQAQLSLQLAVQVTNKAIEAYQELARMQV